MLQVDKKSSTMGARARYKRSTCIDAKSVLTLWNKGIRSLYAKDTLHNVNDRVAIFGY